MLANLLDRNPEKMQNRLKSDATSLKNIILITLVLVIRINLIKIFSALKKELFQLLHFEKLETQHPVDLFWFSSPVKDIIS